MLHAMLYITFKTGKTWENTVDDYEKVIRNCRRQNGMDIFFFKKVIEKFLVRVISFPSPKLGAKSYGTDRPAVSEFHAEVHRQL